jgi:hypothetical protein
MYPLLVAVLLALLLTGCGANSNQNGTADVPNASTSADSSSGIETKGQWSSEATAPPTEASPSDAPSPVASNATDDQVLDVARQAVEYLRERDLNSLAQMIDPEQGLRFSPYFHVNPDTDLVFKTESLPTFKDATKLKWGTADGSGDPIELSFRDYYDKFVYDKDFEDAPKISVNKLIGTGNTTFNGSEIYPNASFVEFHFPGFDEKNDGMDWESLVLVFVPSEADWKLAAIVHGQWTT